MLAVLWVVGGMLWLMGVSHNRVWCFAVTLLTVVYVGVWGSVEGKENLERVWGGLHGWWGMYIRVERCLGYATEWRYKCVCVKKRVDSVCYYGEWTLVWMVLVVWPTQMNMYVRQIISHQLGGSHQNLTFCFFDSNINGNILVSMVWMAHFTKELYLSEVTNLFSIINTDVVKERKTTPPSMCCISWFHFHCLSPWPLRISIE